MGAFRPYQGPETMRTGERSDMYRNVGRQAQGRYQQLQEMRSRQGGVLMPFGVQPVEPAYPTQIGPMYGAYPMYQGMDMQQGDPYQMLRDLQRYDGFQRYDTYSGLRQIRSGGAMMNPNMYMPSWSPMSPHYMRSAPPYAHMNFARNAQMTMMGYGAEGPMSYNRARAMAHVARVQMSGGGPQYFEGQQYVASNPEDNVSNDWHKRALSYISKLETWNKMDASTLDPRALRVLDEANRMQEFYKKAYVVEPGMTTVEYHRVQRSSYARTTHAEKLVNLCRAFEQSLKEAAAFKKSMDKVDGQALHRETFDVTWQNEPAIIDKFGIVITANGKEDVIRYNPNEPHTVGRVDMARGPATAAALQKYGIRLTNETIGYNPLGARFINGFTLEFTKPVSYRIIRNNNPIKEAVITKGDNEDYYLQEAGQERKRLFIAPAAQLEKKEK